jgi:hypothetical protein
MISEFSNAILHRFDAAGDLDELACVASETLRAGAKPFDVVYGHP